MKVEKISANKAKTHTVYKNKEGRRVPGVTTITGVMNKPALVPWANKLGLQGIEVAKYVDDLATIGTLAHLMVEHHLNKTKHDFSDYTPNQISSAENSVIKFFNWENSNDFTMIATELKLVSETYQYGGQCDIYGTLNGKQTLIDIKTCKGIYNDHFTQVIGYKQLLEEANHKVEDVRIIRIGRTEDEGFDDIKVPKVEEHWKRFKLCLDLYNINKELKK